MKKLHLHIRTKDLDRSVAFYTAMFGEEPTQLEADYAKWLLEDPRAHVSLSANTKTSGIDHVGISIETEDELDAVAERLQGQTNIAPEKQAECCYARSNKYWLRDPQGAVWELFQTYAHTETYGADPDALKASTANPTDSCCGPH